jgi:hypothetical protein
MKLIVSVNHEIPTVDNEIEYLSSESLRDYDIVIFDPEFPHLSRIEFTGGGSCLAIEATEAVTKAVAHWKAELRGALQSGKTAFILLNEFERDLGATGNSMKSRNQRTYDTTYIENYSAVPARIAIRNAKGRKIIVKDGRFRSLYDIISRIAEYRVVLTSIESMNVTFSAKDGAAIGSIIRPEGLRGSLVLLPYFSFGSERLSRNTPART